jgi:hypothetical protein
VRRAFALILGLLLIALAGCGSKPKPEMEVSVRQNGESLVVQVKTKNFRVPADGHVHIRLDDGPEIMAWSETYTIPKVSPGQHVVHVELSDLEHRNLGVKQSIPVEVK